MNEPSATGTGAEPVSRLRRIDEVCDRFEAAWPGPGSAGPPPRIEDFMGEVPEAERARLLGGLLALELAYCRDEGRAILPADQVARPVNEVPFPVHVEGFSSNRHFSCRVPGADADFQRTARGGKAALCCAQEPSERFWCSGPPCNGGSRNRRPAAGLAVVRGSGTRRLPYE